MEHSQEEKVKKIKRRTRWRKRKAAAAPRIGKTGINRTGCSKIKKLGVWVVERLEGFNLSYYDGDACRIRGKDGCIKLMKRGPDGEWKVDRVLLFGEFNLNWHYDRAALLKACECMVFKRGINNKEESPS